MVVSRASAAISARDAQGCVIGDDLGRALIHVEHTLLPAAVMLMTETRLTGDAIPKRLIPD